MKFSSRPSRAARSLSSRADLHFAERRRHALERLVPCSAAGISSNRSSIERTPIDREHARDVVVGVRNERHGGALLGFVEELLGVFGLRSSNGVPALRHSARVRISQPAP